MLGLGMFLIQLSCVFFFSLHWSKKREKHPGTHECMFVPLTVFSHPETSYRENLGLFMEEKACKENRKVKVLEIGVWKGDFAQEILDRYHSVIGEYVMIEPAPKLVGSLKPELEKRLKDFPKEYPSISFRHINEVSVDAVGLFPDLYFDWVYIDALHTFEGVRDDIQLYWSKLQYDGLFSGHDFNSKLSKDPLLYLAPWSGRKDGREKTGFPGSYKAAIMHSKEYALPIFYTLEGRYGKEMYQLSDTSLQFRNNPSWFMMKPTYNVSAHKRKGFGFRDGIFTNFHD